jgi:hypothetical protein
MLACGFTRTGRTIRSADGPAHRSDGGWRRRRRSSRGASVTVRDRQRAAADLGCRGCGPRVRPGPAAVAGCSWMPARLSSGRRATSQPRGSRTS